MNNSMEVETRFFGPVRDTAGDCTARYKLSEGATIADLFHELTEADEALASHLYTDGGAISPSITVTKNGRDITFLDGAQTTLEDEDVIRIAPPVQGGDSTL